MQNGSPILHVRFNDANTALLSGICCDTQLILVQAETAAFDSDRSLPQGAFEGATLYTTMSPCPMCTGTAIWLGVKRVVVGDNLNYYGPQELLHNAGIEVIVLNTDDCVRLGKELVSGDPQKWQMVR